MSKKIIFHCPFYLNENAKSASGIRPIRMYENFINCGYEVFLIAGSSSERKRKINNIKSRIKRGEYFDFVYSESSTMPTALTDIDHLPRHIFLDFSFFRFCRRYKIPITLFYRDIYWCFPEYGLHLSFIKKYVAKFFYKMDLYFYSKFLDILYLPSYKMLNFIPFFNGFRHIKELPPGYTRDEHYGHPTEFSIAKSENDTINIFYVGGIGPHYEMHKLFQAVSKFENIKLTICTRELEWQKVKDSYSSYLSPNINVIHASATSLQGLFKQADIFSVFVNPKKYWTFAAPFKFYEYIGYGKPILATNGTLVAEKIQKDNLGWAIDYDEIALENLLVSILNDRAVLEEKQASIAKIQDRHTWEARVRQIAKDVAEIRK